jgi:hypothetical protein
MDTVQWTDAMFKQAVSRQIALLMIKIACPHCIAALLAEDLLECHRTQPAVTYQPITS